MMKEAEQGVGVGGDGVRVAIVGAGPAGLFCAGALLRSGESVRIDLFERLEQPYGLVRYGVAPDHPEIRRVSRQFAKVLAHDAVTLRTGVCVGGDPNVAALRDAYDAVVLASGAEGRRRLGIPGEDLPGSYDAGDVAGWYNGHPEHARHTFNLDCREALVIGNGNVALDMARMLGRSRRELEATDIAPAALEALAASSIRTVYVVGRRGPVQASFSQAELRELAEMERAVPICDAAELALDPASRTELEGLPPVSQAAFERLCSYRDLSRPDAEVRIVFRFLRSPMEVLGDDRVEGIRLRRNRLVGEPGHLRAETTAEEEIIPCGLLLRSIGYQGLPLDGAPFDAGPGVIPNVQGRVTGLPRVYTTGWIAYGPRGVIGTARKHAAQVAACILEDLRQST